MRNPIEDSIVAFVENRFRAALHGRSITPETPLLTSGIIDSFGVLELLAFLEDTHGASIDPGAHEWSELDTARQLGALIAAAHRE